MKLTRVLFAVTMAAMAVSALAEDAKSIIQKQCDAFDTAVLKKDMSWFEKVATPTFHEFDESGKRKDRKASMAEMKQTFGMMTVTKAKSKVLSAKMKGSEIVAISQSTMTVLMKTDPKAKPAEMTNTVKYQQTWKKVGGKWMIEEIKSVPMKSK